MRLTLALASLGVLAACSLWREEPKPAPQTIAYACEAGAPIEVILNPDSRIATVIPQGGAAVLLLPREAASGAAWANDGYSLHTKGQEALWTAGERMLRCRAQGPPPAQ